MACQSTPNNSDPGGLLARIHVIQPNLNWQHELVSWVDTEYFYAG